MVCWGCDKLDHLLRDCTDPEKKASKKDHYAQSSTGASREATRQPAATQPWSQPSGMSVGSITVVQGQAMGAREAVGGCAVIPANTSGNATQGVGLPWSRYCQWEWIVMPKEVTLCLLSMCNYQ